MNGNGQLIQGWVGCLFCITGNAEKFTEIFENRRTVAFFTFFSLFTFILLDFGTEDMYNESVTKHFHRSVPENAHLRIDLI